MSQSAKKEEQPLNKIITRMGSIFRSRSKRASQSNIPTLATGKSSQAQAATAYVVFELSCDDDVGSMEGTDCRQDHTGCHHADDPDNCAEYTASDRVRD